MLAHCWLTIIFKGKCVNCNGKLRKSWFVAENLSRFILKKFVGWKLSQLLEYYPMFMFVFIKQEQWTYCKTQLGSVHIWRQQDFGKFYPPPPVSIERPPDAWRQHLPFKSEISFLKNPLHSMSTLIETLNVYLIQLKTERCHQFRGVY